MKHINNIALGILFGVLFIAISAATNLDFGIPELPASFAGTWLIPSVVAPILEEVSFRVILLNLTLGFGWLIYPINALVFALFHLTAYQSLSGMSASFIAAGIWAIGAVAITRYSGSILPAIIGHAILNIYILISKVLI